MVIGPAMSNQCRVPVAREVTTRARLFDAAAALIGEQGLHATTVDQIVERAGVAKGTVYYHFKSKDELFQALLVEGLKRLAGSLSAEAAAAVRPPAALSGMVRAELENILRYEAFARLMMSQVWRAGSLWGEEALRTLREDIFATIRRVIEAGQASGEFRPGLDAAMAARMIFGMVAMAGLGRDRVGDPPASEDVAIQLVDMALAMVRS
jgi:AcrR family transcriptional regulator